MTVAVATLAERALRRLGVAVVPVADRPPLTVSVASATLATNALVMLGVIATTQVPANQGSVVTTDSIATTALIKLGVIAADETPADDDQQLAVDTAQKVHDGLVAQAAVGWTVSTIPSAVAEEYAQLTALHMASSFGKQGNPELLGLLEGRIRTVSEVARAQSLALSHVNAVHDSLVANANVRWTIDAVPQAVSEEYARLASINAASSFGKQADPAMVPALEGRVRKVAMVMQAPDEASLAVMAVHNDLSARGLVRWTSQDIPDGVGTWYYVLAANLLAPGFGMQPDQAAGVAAQLSLARYIALGTSGERVMAEYY